jgi:hypothetical protein
LPLGVWLKLSVTAQALLTVLTAFFRIENKQL